MSHGFAQLDIERIEIKMRDVNGMEVTLCFGEPGRRLHVDSALNVEYENGYMSLGRLDIVSREYNLKVRY